MAVNITWSSTNGGVAMSDPLDHGSGGNGTTLSSATIYIEHNGTNQLTNCGFYIGEKSGTYTGSFSPSIDLAEILAWGDGSANSYGGLQINMDAVGDFPSGAWPIAADKQPTNGNTFLTGVGDTPDNKILLAVSMGLNNVGVIPSGTAPNVRFQSRIQIPTDEDTTGTREFDQKIRFTFTS
jgi:hypothetical protein